MYKHIREIGTGNIDYIKELFKVTWVDYGIVAMSLYVYLILVFGKFLPQYFLVK